MTDGIQPSPSLPARRVAASLFPPIQMGGGFCLIDWYKLDDNSPRTERVYWEGATSYQGISPGWVDQYHQELEGQQLDLTGAPPGVYYLVSSANPDGNFLEAKLTDNTAWGELPSAPGQQGGPLDRGDRPLPLRHAGHVRRAGHQPLSPAAPL